MELFKASRQWASRPDDERFSTLESAYSATLAYAQSAVESNPQPSTLRAEVSGGDVILSGKTGAKALLTNWAFGQLSSLVKAPAGYLRSLPATLAAQNINHGLNAKYGTAREPKDADASVNLLMHQNGSMLVRSIVSDKYTRIWNHEVIKRLMPIKQYGWTNPRPFLKDDESPAIYASDHDMFVFLVNDSRRIAEGSRNPEGLGRGFFVENSEVGGGALKLTRFLYRYVCCNHIVWGAQNVASAKIIHIGDLDSRMSKFRVELEKYSNESASDEEAKITAARTKVLGATKDEVLDFLFSRSFFTRKASEDIYAIAERHADTDGDPKTVWGVVNGATRYSQTLPYADERTAVDRAAGKVLQIAF